MEHGNFDSTELQQVKSDGAKHQFSCSKKCSFSKQEHSILDASQRSKTSAKLCGLIIFYTLVMVIELIGGLRANSLAILTDAAHLLSDIAGFSISLFTVWVSGWESTPRQSFGYNRLEVIGALLSVQLIWFVSITLIYEAINRLITKQANVNGKLMFAIASFGFVVNFLLVLWLGHDHHGHTHHHDHTHHHHHGQCHEIEKVEEEEESTNLVVKNPSRGTLNINIQGAYLHLVTDLIQSMGVMIAGCIIWLRPNWLVVDLICTLVFSIVALGTTFPMLMNVFGILMERAPREIDVDCLENGLKGIRGVDDVHDVHVWAITVGKYVLACHVVIGNEVCSNEIMHNIREYCEQMFGIHHVTIQIEQEM